MDAQKLTSLVHRDISLANIILVPEPGRATRKGYLIDWDASCESDATGVSIVAGRAVSGHLWFHQSMSQPNSICRAPGNSCRLRCWSNRDRRGGTRSRTTWNPSFTLSYTALSCGCPTASQKSSSRQQCPCSSNSETLFLERPMAA